MHRLLLLTGFIFFSMSGYSQEFTNPEGFYIGSLEVRPSLSNLVPQLPESKFTLTEVDFSEDNKREVNLIAMMERERFRKESSYVELDAPTPTISNGEKTLIEVTNEFRMHDRSSNYDIYTGQKKIPAYQEMRPALFRGSYVPYSGRSRVRAYVSPYTYSPFLR